MQTNSLPKVSVLIPAYNEEKYIVQTLEAVLRQDYPFFEIIITDNASTDRTAILVTQFIESRPLRNVFVTLVYENRRGTNFARERARLAATGSIIAQLDADCIPPANWLRKGVAALCHNRKKRVAVTGPYDYFDGNKWLRAGTFLVQKFIYPLINTLVQQTGNAILIGGNAFIRAEVLEKAGGYNTALTFYGDDIDLGKKLSKFGHVAYIPSLIQQSSSRRYKANGFWEVNKKYQSCFWNLVWNRDTLLQTFENSHPR
jgi:glycosyltransferase involved in cell wall biosynthesis